MTNLILKLMRVSTYTLYSGILTGLALYAGTFYLLFLAFEVQLQIERPLTEPDRAIVDSLFAMTMVLLAIFLVLLGLFSLAWTTYLARVAKKLSTSKQEQPAGQAP